MKAVVLVGGEGTRMRPLTETIPKPLLPLVDRPILDHVLDHLVAHGVDEVVMSSPYLEETFHPFIEERSGNPAIRWVTEREPLGTGGAIVNVLELLGAEPFFALNSDILTDLDLTEMRTIHEGVGAAVTIALHHVDDARAFGLVDTDPTGRIVAFREKPPDAIPGDINAGIYVVDPSALRAWPPGGYLWIEGEVFPRLIEHGALVMGFASDAYWLDLGTPESYLRGHADLLDGRIGRRYEAPWLSRDVIVDATAEIGRSVVVGRGGIIGPGARVERSVVLPDARIGAGARVEDSILGPRAEVGEGAAVIGCVLGEGASVAGGAELRDARVPAGVLADPS
ncbi:MAG TPA: NDP-sugar synthase [Actinomycetota bacterium]|nr:NDP-sugar synthase [Actinomycetota bacterium]